MTDLTNYTESNFMNWCFAGTDMPAAHSNLFLALHTGDPSESGDANEVSASDYSRLSTDVGTDWSVNNNQAENDIDFVFGPVDNDWGTISYFSLWDASSDGNALWYSQVEPEKEVLTNDELQFTAGALTATID